jgi:hypothetical protein
MPNYCDNTLRVHAKGDVLKLAKSLLFKDSEPKESNFSFTCAKPMPEEIRHTNSPNRVISEEEYAQRVKDGTTTEDRVVCLLPTTIQKHSSTTSGQSTE